MRPMEILHRIGEQLTLKRMRFEHAFKCGIAREKHFDITQYSFCVAENQLLPELPRLNGVEQSDIDNLISGRCKALGFEWSWQSGENSWHLAPDTKKEWPIVFFDSIPYRQDNPYGDIRIAWESSRLQHFIALAKLANNNEGIVSDQAIKLIEEQFLSWVDDNPPFSGIHYISAMECALRILSVCYALDMIRAKLQSSDRIWPALLNMIRVHAGYIENRLSLYSSVGNHTIAECAGLIYAGKLFPEMDGAERWVAKGLDILKQEADYQILKDGGGIEQAFWYQLFIIDLYGLVAALLKHKNEAVPPVIASALHRGRKFLHTLAQSPSQLPAVGDSDSGYALSPCLGLSWEGVEISEGISRFDDSGYTVLNDKSSIPCFLLFDHGPLGKSPSYGHGHADALSIMLNIGKQNILIDPGTYTYTRHAQWRSYFRSTRAHNTVMVDGLDQARQETSFMWSQPFKANLLESETENEGVIRLLAQHNGYHKVGVTHWRGIIFRPSSSLLIWDYLDGKGVHGLELNWHLGYHPDEKNGEYEFPILPQSVLMSVEGGEASLHSGTVNPHYAWKSRTYGIKEPITSLQVRYDGPLSHEFVTRIGLSGNLDNKLSCDDDLSFFREKLL